MKSVNKVVNESLKRGPFKRFERHIKSTFNPFSILIRPTACQ